MPAEKTPPKNKRGYTNNNKKNAAYKVTIQMCKNSPNFFQKKFGIKFNRYYLRFGFHMFFIGLVIWI